jgi:hypothetical protein
MLLDEFVQTGLAQLGFQRAAQGRLVETDAKAVAVEILVAGTAAGGIAVGIGVRP